MRIISRGIVPKEEWRFSCPKCKTVFIANRADIKSDWRDGDYVICPVCTKCVDNKLKEAL